MTSDAVQSGSRAVGGGLPAQLLGPIRARLESDFARLSAEVESAGWDVDQLVRVTGQDEVPDETDMGTRLSGVDQEAGLRRNTQELLQQTALALARIEAGSYGTCRRCGEPIDPARLEAFPRATTCLPWRQPTCHR